MKSARFNKGDIFHRFDIAAPWELKTAWWANFWMSGAWYSRLISSYAIGAKTLCGYDLHEAERNEPGKPRFDLNGTYSSDAFLQNLEQRLQHWSATAQNSPLFTFLSLKERLSANISFEVTESNDFLWDELFSLSFLKLCVLEIFRFIKIWY